MTEQEAFEAWAKTEGLEDRLAPHPTIKDVYRDDYVDDLWDGWKARAGLAPFHAEKGAVDDRMNQYEHIGSGLPLLRCPCGYCVQTRAILQAATPTQNNMNKWIIDEPTLLHIMSVAIGAAYVSVEDASKRLRVTAPIMQAATRDTLRPDVPKPDTHYIAPFTGHTLKYHSLDQIVEYANACVRAASAPKGDGND